VACRGGRRVAQAVFTTTAGAPYEPGLLALREGPLLDAVVRSLRRCAEPDVVVVKATGRDHPRRAGLAVHLGHVLDLPSVGVTHRPLYATGSWPADTRGAASPLVLDGEVIGYWVRTRPGRRPLAVHAGWRVDPGQALEVIRATLGPARTPEPLRAARRLARIARARALTDRAGSGPDRSVL
jgi:deoxyribonuclease V